MRRSTIIRSIVAILVVGSLVAGVRWLWKTPLSPIPSKAPVGKLDLSQAGAALQARFVPPKDLSSITIVFPKPMEGSGNFCAHPAFPLCLHVRVSEPGGTNIIDELMGKDRMQWTSWHAAPSLLLMLDGWLGKRLSRDHEYDLSVSVDSAVADLGEVEVFLHWMDGGYVWGREQQKLQLTSLHSTPR